MDIRDKLRSSLGAEKQELDLTTERGRFVYRREITWSFYGAVLGAMAVLAAALFLWVDGRPLATDQAAGYVAVAACVGSMAGWAAHWLATLVWGDPKD